MGVMYDLITKKKIYKWAFFVVYKLAFFVAYKWAFFVVYKWAFFFVSIKSYMTPIMVQMPIYTLQKATTTKATSKQQRQKQTTKRPLPHSNDKTNYKTAYAHLCTIKKNYKKSNFKTAPTSKLQRQNKLPNGHYHTVTTKQTTKRNMPIYVLPKKKL